MADFTYWEALHIVALANKYRIRDRDDWYVSEDSARNPTIVSATDATRLSRDELRELSRYG